MLKNKGLTQRDEIVGGKKRIQAGGFGVLGVTAMGNHPRRKKIQLSEGLGGHTESRGGDGQLALCHGMLNVHEDVLCKFVASPKIFPPPWVATLSAVLAAATRQRKTKCAETQQLEAGRQ